MKRWFLFSFLLLGGCNLAPDVRPGMWRPSGVNETNIQAMLANPADYHRGHGDGTADGNQAAKAVERYRTDKVLPLPQASSQSFQPGGSSASSGAGPQVSTGGN